MRRRHFLFGSLLAAAPWTLASQAVSEPPPSSAARKVELTGTIEKVQIAPRQGMPSLLLQTADGPLLLYLGPMRYLMEQDFRPLAGEVVEVEALQSGSEAVAVRVTLKSRKITLRLRDSNGRPVWQRHGGHHRERHPRR